MSDHKPLTLEQVNAAIQQPLDEEFHELFVALLNSAVENFGHERAVVLLTQMITFGSFHLAQRYDLNSAAVLVRSTSLALSDMLEQQKAADVRN